ncbi:DDE-type integrase/transposase/recombinase [Oligella ureolytica]|uniref:DDE-type integrase/transposase/recombinase n=1 Tax=Oligella ureolytica TaxID=90244 RepID=UPI000E0F195E|nr:DDE-type integrase/transposase/recombinase [Oligella ureolytica]
MMREYHVRFCEGLVVKFRWSTHLSDGLTNQRRFRTLNAIDDFNRETLGIDVGMSLPALRVTRFLNQLSEVYGYPERIHTDNGPEFTSQIFMQWAEQGAL